MRLARLAIVLGFLAPAFVQADESFYLKDGDRVVFYGDSITDQRLYTTFTETYVVTRFPKLNVSFIHSGWGGDRVGGGGGGRIDLRLKRDVLAYKPTVMTVMLGMNDGGVAPFKQSSYDTFVKGYQHIVDTMKSQASGIRLTLIVPSPYDDVTRPSKFEGGYNAVLLRYGDAVKEIAQHEGATVADLNTYVVEATKKAFASDPANAQKLNPDRVHPAPGGQLLMAAALLKAWHAPAIVSEVHIDIKDGNVDSKSENTEVSQLQLKDGVVSWNQIDNALPLPIDMSDALIALAVRSSDVVETLDRQSLKVDGLKDGQYALKIDGKELEGHAFTNRELSEGVNLATLPTPMYRQAVLVHELTRRHNDLHSARWRQVQVPLQNKDYANLARALEALDMLESEIMREQRSTAQPKPHRFELVAKP